MATDRPAGPIVDELGVTFQLDDDDRVTEVLVLAKTIDMGTGAVGLNIASSGLDWITQSGLVAAYQLVQDSTLERDDDD